MAIEPGQTLLHYRIVEKLGEGGMGVVWKAVDTSLGRDVAIKVLPEAFAADGERLARFEQEARLLASLNHQHIAAVYSVHEHEGMRFLAMELVQGEDLAQRLARGPLPVDEALELALQVADALEAAHDSGVIHRDLKPANIQLTPTGQIKVLDFGLAKALAPDTASGDPSLSPTITTAGTVAGMILGTASYMSPEQARGREVDRRADVWAFGCVLFEMLTGRKAFDGETVSDTLASVLKVDPPWDAIPKGTPAVVRRLLHRCLTRDPARRLSHVSGARLDLRETLEGTGAAEIEGDALSRAAPIPGRARWLPWTLAALLAAVAAGTAWLALGDRDGERPVLRLVAPFGDHKLGSPDPQMGFLALAPNGRSLALVLDDDRQSALFLRRLDTGDLIELPGTRNAESPFFSPDSRWVAFFADNKLKKVPVDGGQPVTLCDAQGSNRGGVWTRDDEIIFSPHYTQPLMVVSGGGGQPRPLTEIVAANGERTHRWPSLADGQDVVLFTVGTMDSPESYDGARIDAIRPSSGERKTVFEGASMAWYVRSGHLVFGREGFLFAVPFDVERLQVRGTPVPVVEDVMGTRASGVVHAGFSETGLLAYVAGKPQTRQHRLVWRDRDGVAKDVGAQVNGYSWPCLSPDGQRIAVAIGGASTFDIWVYDLERETLTRLTFEGDNTSPVWSPDGTRIAFASVRNDALMSIYVKSADGTGTPQLLYAHEPGTTAGDVYPTSWSSDGRRLAVVLNNENSANVMLLSLEDGRLETILETPATEVDPALSPDGRWIAYASDESGKFQVYVRPLSGSGGKWQISTDGGGRPMWARDGKELFFRYRDELRAVRIDASGDNLRPGRPTLIFDGLDLRGTVGFDFDVRADGALLFVEFVSEEAPPEGVTVVVNWVDELRRRVPR